MTVDAQMTIALAALLVTVSAIVARVVWGVGRELRELREAVSELRLTIESQRMDDREWVRMEIERHAAGCPARESADE